MTISNESDPFYKRLSFNLISIGLIATALYIGQDILLPLFFSMLLAALLLPSVKFLQRKKIPKILSVILSLAISLVLVFGVLYFLTTQVLNFLDDSDMIKDKFDGLLHDGQKWVSQNFHVGIRKQNQYIHDTAEKIKTSGPALVGKTFLSLTEIFSYLIFIPIYTFLLLYYKDLIKKFLVDSFKNSSEEHVVNILQECQTVSQHYILGLLIEMTIVFALNAAGFLILGIHYAVFLALVGALLNLIPYVGMLVANVFCMVITMISSPELSDVLWVGVVLLAVQFIDNNFLMPLIVGSKVRINALATIVGVLIGGALCGVPGMFLAIPGVAVLKVIADRVDGLKAWGTLMGDPSGDKQRDKLKGVGH
jgi:predicted PurR-regulated permease PerM